MELKDICPSEIKFQEKIFKSNLSNIFLVEIRGQTCVMKVEHHLDARGIIPHFFESIFGLDPKLYQPHLDSYIGEEYLPNAIFLEYIPNIESIGLHNYTEKRLDALVEGLREIHKASVFHGDAKARNMIVFKDDPDRVMWIDFNSSVTFEPDKMTDRNKRCLEEEELVVVAMKNKMPDDIREGRIFRTRYWFE